jgi:hypothetical protein
MPKGRTGFRKVAVAVAAMALVASAHGVAASPTAPRQGHDVAARGDHARNASLEVLDKPSERFRRSLKVASHKLERAQAGSAPGAGAVPGAYPAPQTLGVDTAALEQIALCESGGDPAAVSADGAYRGKYQFGYGTWASVGGSGDPAGATEAEQDYRAALLYAQGGSGHWPNCA